MKDYTTIYNGFGVKMGRMEFDPDTESYYVVLESETYDYYEGTDEEDF